MICIVDGPYLSYRAYCAGGVEGMYRATLSTLFEISESHDAVWLLWERPDGKGSELRRGILPEYKCQRDPKPEEYLQGIRTLSPIVRDCGWNQAFPAEGEADDAALTLTNEFASAGKGVSLWGRDKDWMQLLAIPGVSMLLPPTAGLGTWERVAAEDVPRLLGVPVEHVADLLALAGDTSDGVPGMPRIGHVRAKALLATCPDLVPLILDGQGDAAVARVAERDIGLAAHAQSCTDRADLLETMVRVVKLYPVDAVRGAGRLDARAAERGLRAIDCGWAVARLAELARDDWDEAADDSGKLDDWSE